MIKILDALGVGGDQWTAILTIAREASEKGWWESDKTMGDRQTLYANLEAGAPVGNGCFADPAAPRST